jgi:hypothetical protein
LKKVFFCLRIDATTVFCWPYQQFPATKVIYSKKIDLNLLADERRLLFKLVQLKNDRIFNWLKLEKMTKIHHEA